MLVPDGSSRPFDVTLIEHLSIALYNRVSMTFPDPTDPRQCLMTPLQNCRPPRAVNPPQPLPFGLRASPPPSNNRRSAPAACREALWRNPWPLRGKMREQSQMCCHSVTANKNPIRQTTGRLWKTAVPIAHRPFVDDDELSDSHLIRDAGIYRSRLRDLIHRSRL
jgi:hypothetical protein